MWRRHARRRISDRSPPLLHDELIATIAGGLSVAFLFAFIAHRLRLPLILGYLMAGVALGPATPGFTASTNIAPQLAEIGVILLMFGVGLHFSINDLLSVRRIALPGALVQVAIATSLGLGLATFWGWSFGEALVLGIALSVASTVVLLRALERYRGLETIEGRVAVGWLVVEDLITVIVLVMLPAMAGLLGGTGEEKSGMEVAKDLGITVAKIVAFIVIMLIAGARVVPWVLHKVEATEQRELFVLAVLTIALGLSFEASEVFDVSFALGAFLGGVVVNGSPHSHRAGEEALPLREAFSVLFFVSVGMLIEPRVFIEEPLHVAGVLAIIMVGKGLAAIGIVALLRGTASTGLVVAAGLSQIGEFSFILIEASAGLGLFPEEGRDLVLGAAIVSIALNPLLFYLAQRLAQRLSIQSLESARAAAAAVAEAQEAAAAHGIGQASYSVDPAE